MVVRSGHAALWVWVCGDLGGLVMEEEHTGGPLGILEVLVLMEIKGQAEPLSTGTPIP